MTGVGESRRSFPAFGIQSQKVPQTAPKLSFTRTGLHCLVLIQCGRSQSGMYRENTAMYDVLKTTIALITAPGELFEIKETEIAGVPFRVWANAPGSLRDVWLSSAQPVYNPPFKTT